MALSKAAFARRRANQGGTTASATFVLEALLQGLFYCVKKSMRPLLAPAGQPEGMRENFMRGHGSLFAARCMAQEAFAEIHG